MVTQFTSSGNLEEDPANRFPRGGAYRPFWATSLFPPWTFGNSFDPLKMVAMKVPVIIHHRVASKPPPNAAFTPPSAVRLRRLHLRVEDRWFWFAGLPSERQVRPRFTEMKHD